ncbi:MAG TPA: glutamate racemase [Saprospiraceae bacterium]|nr:glutamate racemase [Saprospiraceae bacterium]HMQ81587.1 glutamate racemase [Saprospiraceae bacterium]
MAHSTQPIGIFDSGIGGLTVANAIYQRLPNESTLYFGDTAHVPYGPRPAGQIRELSRQISAYLLERGCKVIVIACNTATTAALNYLRNLWPDVPIIGTEPAIKPAAQATLTGKIGILATQGTFKSDRYSSLTERFAADITVFENPCKGLVSLIEMGKIDASETNELLESIIYPMLEEGIDTLVLGCTHYPFIRPIIEKIVGPDVAIIDPAPAIAKRVEQVLREHHLLNVTDEQAIHAYEVSGDGGHFLALAQHLLQHPIDLQTQIQAPFLMRG